MPWHSEKLRKINNVESLPPNTLKNTSGYFSLFQYVYIFMNREILYISDITFRPDLL